MPVCNPTATFVTGSKKEEFTYEGGTELFHFSPYDNKLSQHMDFNVILFANDEQHAKNVLGRLFQWYLDTLAKYVRKVNDGWDETLKEDKERNSAKIRNWLPALQEGKITLNKAPKNQFYEVGWASNDTLLH